MELTASCGEHSRVLYGHLISRTPLPQQSQQIMLSGDAPRCGYSGLITRPHFCDMIVGKIHS